MNMPVFNCALTAKTSEFLARNTHKMLIDGAWVDSASGNTLDVVNPADRKSTRLNSSHIQKSRMPSSA